MKIKVLWWGVSLLLVASLALATGVQEGDVQEEVVASGEPQYGGTLTTARIYGDPTGADMFETPWPAQNYVHPVLDHLLTGNRQVWTERHQ